MQRRARFVACRKTRSQDSNPHRSPPKSSRLFSASRRKNTNIDERVNNFPWTPLNTYLADSMTEDAPLLEGVLRDDDSTLPLVTPLPTIAVIKEPLLDDSEGPCSRDGVLEFLLVGIVNSWRSGVL